MTYLRGISEGIARDSSLYRVMKRAILAAIVLGLMAYFLEMLETIATT